MSQAFVAVLLIHLHFPEAGSLKARRKDLASVKAQLHTRLGLAVAEVGEPDLWQRATLAATTTSGSVAQLEQCADRVERWLGERFPDGVRVERVIASWEDLAGADSLTGPAGKAQ